MALPGGNQPTDEQLLADITAGNPFALRQFIDRYDRLVRYTVYKQSRDHARRDPFWLDSVASEFWTDFCRSLAAGKSDAIENIPSYIIQSARFRCIDALRKAGRDPQATGSDADENDLSQLIEDKDVTFDVLDRIEQVDELRNCMAGLPPADKVLCGQIELITAGKWREASSRLGIAESTLRSRWARVLDRLKQCLEKK